MHPPKRDLSLYPFYPSSYFSFSSSSFFLQNWSLQLGQKLKDSNALHNKDQNSIFSVFESIKAASQSVNDKA